MRKLRGFDKPVLYVFRGKPNLTKSTIAKKVGGTRYFETDILRREDRFDIRKFPTSDVEIIILGGKWYKNWFSMWYITRKVVKLYSYKYSIIIIDYKKGNSHERLS